MTFGNHTLDNIRVQGCSVDCPFRKIVPGDEECGLESVAFENVQQFGCIEVWTVIIGQRHHIVLHAVEDVVVVRDRPDQRPRIIEGTWSGRSKI